MRGVGAAVSRQQRPHCTADYGAFFIGGGERGMKQRYTFKDGRVTVQTDLYHMLTEQQREPTEAVVLLVVCRREQEVDDDPAE